jgi:curved DNA-binding protein CbpA
MTDYFALLQQPRRPWLDLDELKERYQALTLAQHPDRERANKSSHDFSEVNQAYRILKDPKLRLQHLLQLSGIDPKGDKVIPEELLDLFGRIGDFVRSTDELLQRRNATQNALARSLVRAEIVTQEEKGKALLQTTRYLCEVASEETRSLNETWAQVPEQLGQLFRRFAYLTRWLEQLEERQFQLSA